MQSWLSWLPWELLRSQILPWLGHWHGCNWEQSLLIQYNHNNRFVWLFFLSFEKVIYGQIIIPWLFPTQAWTVLSFQRWKLDASTESRSESGHLMFAITRATTLITKISSKISNISDLSHIRRFLTTKKRFTVETLNTSQAPLVSFFPLRINGAPYSDDDT